MNKIYENIEAVKIAHKEVNDKLDMLMTEYNADVVCDDCQCSVYVEIPYYDENGNTKLYPY